MDSGSSLLKAPAPAGEGRAARPRLPAVVVVLLGYLAVTAPLLPLGGLGGRHLAALALHLAAAAALAAIPLWGATGRIRRTVADWLPLLIVPVLYAELPLLMEALPGPVRYHDPLVAALEQRLFGGQPAFEWAGAWPLPALSELLHACYFSYYPLIYLPPLLLYLRRRPASDRGGAAYRETILAVVLAFVACFLVFIPFPVQGPRYLGVPGGIPDGPVRGLVLAVLERGSSRGAAFPSSHVSVAVAQMWMALRHQPAVGRWTVPVAAGLAAGAVYGGFHYGIDALVGAAVGVLAAAAAGSLRRRLESAPQAA